MRFFIILSLFLCPSVFGQGFVISDSLYTETSNDTYDFHLIGSAFFSDSVVVVYKVSSADSSAQLLFTNSVDFTEDTVTFPQGFSYNSIDSTIQIVLGNYPTKQLLIELISFVGEIKREHIYLNIPLIESVIEDEE